VGRRRKPMRFFRTYLLLSVLLTFSLAAQADKVDDYVREQMRMRQIPGLSLAIIQDGKIVKAKGYGVIEKGSKTPVTSSTLFQAGSISKPVAAFGGLSLVEKGRLALDEDVNGKLSTWKVPENDFTKEKKVTLRGLVSHTAGLTVHGFPGYDVQGTVPTLVQIFNGEKPANTAAIRVNVKPGSLWRYSGGGYTIMQQMVIDVVGKPYPQFMKEAVLTPLGMTESSYEQPLPEERAKVTATGHYRDRSLVRGRWHVYPEMAAAGLWTTPSDLARFAMEIQHSLAGKSNKVISAEMTRQMLTEQKNGFGLGVALAGKGPTLRFSHGGRDEGFDAFLEAYAERGQGAAIMINANDNSGMVSRIMRFIGKEYGWPEYPVLRSAQSSPVKVDAKTLAAYAGRYEIANNRMLTFVVDKGRLITLADGFMDEEFIPEAVDRFSSADREGEIQFVKDGTGRVTGFLLKSDGQERKVPRVGPLIRSLKTQADPDPARTQKVETVVKAFAEGKIAEVSSLITPGAKADFPATPYPDLAGFRSLTFVAEEDIADHPIERHGGKVSRVLYYKLLTDKSSRYLLIHLTIDGLITDFDVVND
jgi:CubicO group peptidase (beta-lactamase class C family)